MLYFQALWRSVWDVAFNWEGSSFARIPPKITL
jgi:hypothetical protein